MHFSFFNHYPQWHFGLSWGRSVFGTTSYFQVKFLRWTFEIATTEEDDPIANQFED